MKFNASPKSSDLTTTGAAIVGAAGGGMIARGLVSMIPAGTGTDEASLKSDRQKKILARLGIIALGFYVSSALDGRDATAALAKGAAAGAAILQVNDLVKDLAEASPSIKRGAEATTRSQKFLAATVGLAGCGCGGMNGNAAYAFLNGPRRRHSRLRAAMTRLMPMRELGTNDSYYQAALVAGENASADV